MEDHLIPVNAVVAMYTTTQTSWPRPFHDAGYRLEGLEFPLEVSDSERVVPDAVGFNRNINGFLLHEAKGGSNIENDQARRYSRVAAETLVRVLGVTVESPLPLKLQTSYACLRAAEDRILQGLESVGMEVPVLSFGSDDVRAVGGSFEDPALSAAFASPVPLPGPPPGIITLDANSPNGAFDRVVFPSLVAAASLGMESISVSALTEQAVSHYAIYPGPYKRRLRAVAAAARRAADDDRDHWEFRGPTGTDDDGLIRIHGSPERTDPRGRTQQYQAIRNRLETSQRGRRRREISGQGVLFGSSDLEEELNRATSSDAEEREEET